MSRTLRPLAALAMFALTVAGCSNGSAGNGSSGAAGGSTAASHTSTGASREQAVKFAACMQRNGYPDFPDPKASGQFPSFAINVSPGVWDRALLACKALKPPVRLNARLSPVQRSAALKFARCVRAQGVKDFPDPADDEPLVDATKIPSANRPGGISTLNAAIRTAAVSSAARDAAKDLGAGRGGSRHISPAYRKPHTCWQHGAALNGGVTHREPQHPRREKS